MAGHSAILGAAGQLPDRRQGNGSGSLQQPDPELPAHPSPDAFCDGLGQYRTGGYSKLNGLQIGWIDGGVDEAHHWAGLLGAEIIQLDDNRLITGNFGDLDVIVAGVFAGSTRPLNRSMQHIRPWIERGGHFVSQYHRSIDNWDKMLSAPLRLQPGSPSIRWRVTDATG